MVCRCRHHSTRILPSHATIHYRYPYLIFTIQGHIIKQRGAVGTLPPDRRYTGGGKDAQHAALDWIGIVSLFGVAVSINWWVAKSYSDRMDRRFDRQDARFERLESLMVRLVRDVGLLMGAMGIYPAAKAKAGSGE